MVIASALVLLKCSPPPKNYTPSDLEGNWSLLKVEVIEEKQSIAKYKEATDVETTDEKPFPVRLSNGILKPSSPRDLTPRMGDLIFSRDSMFSLNYPLEKGKNNKYTIEADLLKIENRDNDLSISLNSAKDTMLTACLSDFGLYVEKTYQKANFSDSILNILKLYDVNFPLLAGTWELIREATYEGGLDYILDFPYDIPDILEITKEELIATLHTDRSCYMLTSGKKRKYFLSYSNESLRLRPDSWYKEVDPWIHFYRVREEEK